ncbi:SLBB domain-containing protein [Nodosilinea sp. FACHB-131]|uniref:polysaccharide biosynthesis/export family protein n=1 Tax=Cyanophyceae TaxID=3028117 RepID=UPI001685726B|nr:SLBB domain-containing protein [Nodosilinea sp. FACHB-131]MBD1872397.1 SLBB domain-containing protein [Nodosilinea sp. FACHB-131]
MSNLVISKALLKQRLGLALTAGVLLIGIDGLYPSAAPAQRMPGGSTTAVPVVEAQKPPTTTAAPRLSPQVTNEPYTLGAGDRVQLALFQLPQYSGEFEVQVDGTLTLPVVGDVNVQGLTLDTATERITARYSQFLRRPGVTLNLLTRRPLVIGVAGEVNRPGSYTLAINGTAFPTITQLLTQAGGVTGSANVREVQIRRLRNGQTQLFAVNLWDLVSGGDLGQDITLRDGDSIFIPSTLVPLEEAQLLAEAAIAPTNTSPINIAVVGEVFRPGPYTLRGGSTRTGDAGLPGGEGGGSSARPPKITDAIQIAGGIKPMANIRQVQVRRLTRTSGEQVFTVDLWSLLEAGATQQNALLQEGDTVFIPTATTALGPAEASSLASASFAPDTIRINVVGEVRNAGLVEVPPNTPLNQGILAAGGFNTRARETTVGLVRLNPDGTVTQREINIDFAQGISDADNPALQNNDIIIVGRSGLASFSDTLGGIANPLANFLNILSAPFRIFNLF